MKARTAYTLVGFILVISILVGLWMLDELQAPPSTPKTLVNSRIQFMKTDVSINAEDMMQMSDDELLRFLVLLCVTDLDKITITPEDAKYLGHRLLPEYFDREK